MQGVGRKTAERLVVELRDKIDTVPAGAAGASRGRGVLPRSERFDDAVAALVSLGYTAPQARDAVQEASDANEGASSEILVRRALALLGKAAVPARG
jgi:Holliday junction DNA helicase RuvA